MTTHILLDVDGVINALSRSLYTGYPGSEWNRGVASGYTITWNTQVIEYLNRIISENHLVVLSTWRQDTIDVIFPLVGLNVPEEHVVLDKDTDPSSYHWSTNNKYWWKRKFAIEFFETHPDDRFIWIDDDHPYYPDHLGQEAEYSGRLLKVCPDAFYGISYKEMKMIDEFIYV